MPQNPVPRPRADLYVLLLTLMNVQGTVPNLTQAELADAVDAGDAGDIMMYSENTGTITNAGASTYGGATTQWGFGEYG